MTQIPQRDVKKTSSALTDIFARVSSIYVAIRHFLQKDTLQLRLFMSVFFVLLLALISGVIYVASSYIALDRKASFVLRDVKTYSDTVSMLDKSYDTIDVLLEDYTRMSEQFTTYGGYLFGLQVPYQHLMQYIYLPSLYIWKNPFTQQIDPGLVWSAFLAKNPFNDVRLIQQRSNFFKQLGDGISSTQVLDVSIGKIKEDDMYYMIPLEIQFTSPSKRSFLMLIDKLSQTSNPDNILLINKFMYYLWEEIRTSQQDILPADDVDVFIGQSLYDWLYNKKSTALIDNDLLVRVIQNVAQCQDADMQRCLYDFRSMYRSLPYLAYGVGWPFVTDKKAALHSFLTSLPPLLIIDDFTFSQVSAQSALDASYQWRIHFTLYGKAISQDDLDEVSSYLGSVCFDVDSTLIPTIALDRIDTAIASLADVSLISQGQNTELISLRSIVTDIVTNYDGLTSYNKMIKLFELYTMLSRVGVCSLR